MGFGNLKKNLSEFKRQTFSERNSQNIKGNIATTTTRLCLFFFCFPCAGIAHKKQTLICRAVLRTRCAFVTPNAYKTKGRKKNVTKMSTKTLSAFQMHLTTFFLVGVNNLANCESCTCVFSFFFVE